MHTLVIVLIVLVAVKFRSRIPVVGGLIDKVIA
jgi:cyanate permease